MTATASLVLATAAALIVAAAPPGASTGPTDLAPPADHRAPAQVDHDHGGEVEMIDEAIDRIDRMLERAERIGDALDDLDAILDRLYPESAEGAQASAVARQR